MKVVTTLHDTTESSRRPRTPASLLSRAREEVEVLGKEGFDREKEEAKALLGDFYQLVLMAVSGKKIQA